MILGVTHVDLKISHDKILAQAPTAPRGKDPDMVGYLSCTGTSRPFMEVDR